MTMTMSYAAAAPRSKLLALCANASVANILLILCIPLFWSAASSALFMFDIHTTRTPLPSSFVSTILTSPLLSEALLSLAGAALAGISLLFAGPSKAGLVGLPANLAALAIGILLPMS
jgi:hypothetical protein